MVGSFGNGYASGQSGWQLARTTAIGGVAGAASGVVGGWLAPIGRSMFVANGLRCGVGEGLFGGAAGGFTYGAIDGGYNGYLQHGWGGVARGALVGGAEGGLAGGVIGGGLGFLSGRICFVAGTQVVVGVEDEDGQDTLPQLNAREGSSSVATALRLKYVTAAIEELVARGGGEGGSGGDQFVLTRDQHDPQAPLARYRISRTYRRIAYHLQVLTIRDADGQEQTIHVTGEHPFYVVEKGWTSAKLLSPEDILMGLSGEVSTVTENVGEEHPYGVMVYNLEVEASHTYFVRAQQSVAEALWVHNAEYGGEATAGRAEMDSSLASELAAARENLGVVPEGKTVAANQAGERTLSGWTDTEGFVPSREQVAQVMAKADDIGFEFKAAGGLDRGVPGRYFASHAEPQLSLLSDNFAVSRDMCASCRSFMSTRAVVENETFVVDDPTRTWTFSPTSTSWASR